MGNNVILLIPLTIYIVVTAILWCSYDYRRDTTSAQDRRDAFGWPLRVARWLIMQLWVILSFPARTMAWTMVAFDHDSEYRQTRRRVYQRSHAEVCTENIRVYRSYAAESKAAGYPLDAMVHENLADLMEWLAKDFNEDAAAPETPRIVALSPTAATRSVDI